MGAIGKSVLFVIVVTGLFWIDGQLYEGDYSKSITGQTLKSYGGYEYGLLAYEFIDNGAQWVKEVSPVYKKAFLEWAEPYQRLIRDLSVVTYNGVAGAVNKVTSYVTDKYPVAQYWVQKNLPELRDAALNAAVSAVDVARNGTRKAAVYIQNNVFVGSWSPDNMKKVTLEAFNATQQYATSTYSWILQAINQAPATPKTRPRN